MSTAQDSIMRLSAEIEEGKAENLKLRAMVAKQLDYIIHTHDESHDEEPSDDCSTCQLVHESISLITSISLIVTHA